MIKKGAVMQMLRTSKRTGSLLSAMTLLTSRKAPGPFMSQGQILCEERLQPIPALDKQSFSRSSSVERTYTTVK